MPCSFYDTIVSFSSLRRRRREAPIENTMKENKYILLRPEQCGMSKGEVQSFLTYHLLVSTNNNVEYSTGRGEININALAGK